jgi:flagellum-specific peptidoglycan hydrolase FlgJ
VFTYLVDRWYKDYGRFKGVNRATSRNECARLLVKEGYATDPDYATKLIQIMDRQLQNSGEKEDPDPHNG